MELASLLFIAGTPNQARLFEGILRDSGTAVSLQRKIGRAETELTALKILQHLFLVGLKVLRDGDR